MYYSPGNRDLEMASLKRSISINRAKSGSTTRKRRKASSTRKVWKNGETKYKIYFFTCLILCFLQYLFFYNRYHLEVYAKKDEPNQERKEENKQIQPPQQN